MDNSGDKSLLKLLHKRYTIKAMEKIPQKTGDGLSPRKVLVLPMHYTDEQLRIAKEYLKNDNITVVREEYAPE